MIQAKTRKKKTDAASGMDPAFYPEPNSAPARPKRSQISRTRALLLLLFLLGAGAGVVGLRNAWQETTRREAYLPELEAQARRDPNDGRLLALMGARLADSGNYAAAAQTLERATAAGATDASVWLSWSASYAANGENVKAGTVLRLGLRDPQAAPAIRAALARVRKLGDAPPPGVLAEAISPRGLERLLAVYGGGSFLNGVAAWRARRDPDASGFATREARAKREPKNVTAQVLWMDALRRNRRLPEAAAVGRRLTTGIAPNSPEAHRALGDVLFDLELYAKAGLAYKEALRLRPDWPPAVIGLGNAAVEKKMISVGIRTFEQATKLDPRSADAWIGLGRAYHNQRFRFDKALTAMQTAARLAPGRTDYFPYYSDVLRANFRFDEAEAVLRRRVAAAPADARSRYLLALILLDNKPTPDRTAEAERALRTSLRLQPGVASAQIRLAQILSDRNKPGDNDQAIRLVEAALNESPNDGLATNLLARCLQRAGRVREASAARQRALVLSRYAQQVDRLSDLENRKPLDPQVHRQLAALYESGGEPEKAQRQRDMAYMLERHKKAAEKGILALRSATVLSAEEGGDAAPDGDKPAAAAKR